MRRVSACEIRLTHQCRSFADAQDDKKKKNRMTDQMCRMTKKEKQDDRSDAQKFVTLSECEESPLMRLVSRVNADPSLTLRMN